MTGKTPRPLLLGVGLGLFAAAMLAVAPVAEAQYFWSPWFQQQPTRPKPRAVKPKPPGDDLPPIVPKESSAPPPPDDRPYDTKLLRLAEILGAVHYLRELCGAEEGQLWRNQMKDVLRNEGSTAVRRAKLVNSFNDGYRGYRRTYRTCTSSATLAITRFSTEGAQIAVALAKPSSVYANRNASAEAAAPQSATGEGAPAPASGPAAPAPNANEAGQTGAIPNAQAPANQAAANPAAPTPVAPKPGEAGQGAPPAEGAQDAAQPDAASQGEQHRKRTKKAQKPKAKATGEAAQTDTVPHINR